MNNEEKNNKLNSLEKQIEEINEWQENVYNPGYYVGSGKIPLLIKNLFKLPFAVLIVGIIFVVPSIYNIVTDFSLSSVLANITILTIGSILCIGAILRLRR